VSPDFGWDGDESAVPEQDTLKPEFSGTNPPQDGRGEDDEEVTRRHVVCEARGK